MRAEKEMYKSKYIEFSSMTDKVNEVMSKYVVLCIEFECLYKLYKEGN